MVFVWKRPLIVNVKISISVFIQNTMAHRQNGRHFADAIFKYIFLKYKGLHLDADMSEVCSWRFNCQYQYVNIASGNGLWRKGAKPSPDPMLTEIYNATWRQQIHKNIGECFKMNYATNCYIFDVTTPEMNAFYHTNAIDHFLTHIAAY